MLPAILSLEWHYLVDFFADLAAAALALWSTEQISETSESGDSRIRLLTRRFAWRSVPQLVEQAE
jgi:hypothetical protein